MPSRAVVAAVLLFWLGSTTLLIYREVVPRWRAGAAPPFHIDLTDEVGSPQAGWNVFHQDRQIGRGFSQVRRLEDRSFELKQKFRFDDFELPLGLVLKTFESAYRVTPEGKLLGLRVNGKVGFPLNLGGDLDAEMNAEVKDGLLTPRFTVAGQPIDMLGGGSLDFSEQGSILNPMHLVHRLPGLREGQRWKVALLDPLKMFAANELVGKVLPRPAFPFLEAEVGTDTIEWNGQETPCFQVVYREPGRRVVAGTWVRRVDGLVLAQEARHEGYEFTIRRIPAPE
jgi:hypothetical protein